MGIAQSRCLTGDDDGYTFGCGRGCGRAPLAILDALEANPQAFPQILIVVVVVVATRVPTAHGTIIHNHSSRLRSHFRVAKLRSKCPLHVNCRYKAGLHIASTNLRVSYNLYMYCFFCGTKFACSTRRISREEPRHAVKDFRVYNL